MMFYKTVENQAEIEIIIEKSRFIGHIIPINWHEHSDMDSLSKEAEDFILSIRNKHKEATHNVPVYVIGLNYEVQKYSDDGEPSKTAGIPILEMLKNEGIMNVVLVITRYFGGTKLGTGGLVRAYTSTAKLALEEARVIKKEKHDLVQIVAAYTALGKI
ncbi:MAG: YigZ family protein, partial [Peptostreptococcales bacterium]